MAEGRRLSRFPLCQRILWDGDLKLVFNGFDCESSVNCMLHARSGLALLHATVATTTASICCAVWTAPRC